MTIRSLAAGLGVSPMALYRYIRGKDDLLGEVVDRLLAGSWRPALPPDGSRAWLTEAAVKFRHFLVSQPAALHVYLQHPVASPAALERMAAVIDVLHRAGLDDQAAGRAYGALHTYTIGFAALEASRSRAALGDDGAPGVSRRLAAYTGTDQFLAGLGYLLDGIGLSAGRERT